MARSTKKVPAGIASKTLHSFRFVKTADNRAQRRTDRRVLRQHGIEADLGAAVRRYTCHSYAKDLRVWLGQDATEADFRK